LAKWGRKGKEIVSRFGAWRIGQAGEKKKSFKSRKKKRKSRGTSEGIKSKERGGKKIPIFATVKRPDPVQREVALSQIITKTGEGGER